MATGEMAFGTTDAFDARPGQAEAGLVAQCRRGDGQAFARLVEMHEGLVYNLAARLLGDPEEARDLSQDVFLQVYRTLGHFRGQSRLKTWIYRIVVNQCRNRQRFWRRRRRDQSLALEELGATEAAQLVGAARDDSPYEVLRRRERGQQVQEALLRVSFDHRAVLLLKEVEELSCDEIAATLGLAEGTVKSRLARARDALRAVLAPAEETP